MRRCFPFRAGNGEKRYLAQSFACDSVANALFFSRFFNAIHYHAEDIFVGRKMFPLVFRTANREIFFRDGIQIKVDPIMRQDFVAVRVENGKSGNEIHLSREKLQNLVLQINKRVSADRCNIFDNRERR